MHAFVLLVFACLLYLRPIFAEDQYDICPDDGDVFINAGGKNLPTNFRCDSGAYVTGNTATFTSKRSMDEKGSCIKQYESHRWAVGSSDLTYTIPVPPGEYMVYLMFMEVWQGATNGTRLFSVSLNGNPVVIPGMMNGAIDVYSIVGVDNPIFVNTTAAAVNNAITVKLGRIPGKNNPMISGIGLKGVNANQLVGNDFLKSCDKALVIDPSVTPITTSPSPSAQPSSLVTTPPEPTSKTKAPSPPRSPAPTSPDPCASATVETNFTSEGHVAHSVSGGPYIETDFTNAGGALVELDGLGSHSHASDPENGFITKYVWSWKDANGSKTAEGAVVAPKFPLGVTELTLEVTDQYCNKAAETTTVTVASSTMPGAYCYYYDLLGSEPTTVPLSLSLLEGPRPRFAAKVGDINFGSTESFGTFPFVNNAFAARCVYSIEVTNPGPVKYNIVHSGPIQMFYDGVQIAASDSTTENVVTTSEQRMLTAGFHSFQLLYVKPASLDGTLKLQYQSGAIVPPSVIRHDSATKLPVITSVSKLKAFANEFVTIKGSAFINGVVVKFGNVIAEPIESYEGSILLRVPPTEDNELIVDVIVSTNAGQSNGITFTYGTVADPCEVSNWLPGSLLTSTGATYSIKDIAVLKYGPDGRLYLGSTRSSLYALTLASDLKVTNVCQKNIQGNGPRQWILGLIFSPATTSLKLYFSTSTMEWLKKKVYPYTKGWHNGKVRSITLNGPTSCFNDDVTTVVSGLPVSNHDHGVNFLEFLPDGTLLISVGGLTNGGISKPNDNLGGIPASLYSGSILACPSTGTAITYSNLTHPDKAEVTGGACKIYAAGFRNSFAGEIHTNGALYVTDNGPNQNFGAFSTDCQGGEKSASNEKDSLIRVEPGQCHGHPNIPRALATKDSRQCVRGGSGCVKPILSNLRSSTNGIIDYRSNVFKGNFKGNLFLVRFSDNLNKKGQIVRVQLNEDGGVKPNGVNNFFSSDSGLSIVEGPRGELIMSRVFKSSFYVLKPVCKTKPKVTYLIGVHPRRGPYIGGHRVTISGFNFGKNPSATFGAKPCLAVQVIDDESFTCLTPPNLFNTQVKVVVNGTLGENFPTKGSDYWYL